MYFPKILEMGGGGEKLGGEKTRVYCMYIYIYLCFRKFKEALKETLKGEI